jgi:hypothetical protein
MMGEDLHSSTSMDNALPLGIPSNVLIEMLTTMRNLIAILDQRLSKLEASSAFQLTVDTDDDGDFLRISCINGKYWKLRGLIGPYEHTEEAAQSQVANDAEQGAGSSNT